MFVLMAREAPVLAETSNFDVSMQVLNGREMHLQMGALEMPI